MASCRQGRHQASNQNSTGFGLKNFFRAPPARSAGKPMEHSYRHRLRFGTRFCCQNFRASFQGFSKTCKRRTEAYRMHVGTDFLKLPPATGQYWSLFQYSMLGTGGTCDTLGARCIVLWASRDEVGSLCAAFSSSSHVGSAYGIRPASYHPRRFYTRGRSPGGVLGGAFCGGGGRGGLSGAIGGVTCPQGQALVHHTLPLPPLALPLTIPSH